MSRPALSFRAPELVLALLGLVYEAEEPIPWPELVETFTTERRSWKTVENTIYELVQLGALHRVGKPADRRSPDTRALRPTLLGRAWLERELLPLPGEIPHNEQDPDT